MYFWCGYTLHKFLFESLNTHSVSGLVGICIGIFCFALLYEGLRMFRALLLQKNSPSAGKSSEICKSSKNKPTAHVVHVNGGGGDCCIPEEDEDENSPSIRVENSNSQSLVNCTNRTVRQNKSVLDILHLTMASLFHSVYVFIGFSLMNAVMTFNVYIFVSTIIGIGVGYFIFCDYTKLRIPYRIPECDLIHRQPLLLGTNGDLAQCDTVANGNIVNSGTQNIITNSSQTNEGIECGDNQLIVRAETHNVLI